MKKLLFFAIFLQASASIAQNSGWSLYSPWPVSEHLYSVHAFDVNHAIAVGERATLIRTTDGGITWNRYQDVGAYESYDMWSVTFTDDMNSWIVGNNNDNMSVILKTTDGGASWQPHFLATELYKIRSMDPLNGWVIGISGDFYKTTNGGVSWSFLSNIQSGCQDFFFVNADTGWVVGWADQKRKTEYWTFIKKTTNGGLD